MSAVASLAKRSLPTASATVAVHVMAARDKSTSLPEATTLSPGTRAS